MCFRPPEAGAGEIVCPGCYLIIAPDENGKCPECGAQMIDLAEAAIPPSAPSAPDVPTAPQGAPKPPSHPE